MNKRADLIDDERGNVVVIAVFMSACLVGCLFYMFGLGEAMIYRQELRAAADATAFGSAVLDAVGMNIVSMLNIAMAVALSILLLLQMIFLIGVVLTLFALLLEIPTLGGDSPISAGLIDFDAEMYETISEGPGAGLHDHRRHQHRGGDGGDADALGLDGLRQRAAGPLQVGGAGGRVPAVQPGPRSDAGAAPLQLRRGKARGWLHEQGPSCSRS